MTRAVAAGLLVCLAAYDDPAIATGQPALIVLDVGVEKSDGTPVTTLRAADFEIFVNSMPRPVVSFSPENRPLVVAALVDVSASMSRRPLGEDPRYRRVLETIIRELETGDRAAVGRVSVAPLSGTVVSGDATALFDRLSDVLTVPDFERFGPSPLWDALISAIDLVSLEPGSRAVMLWTDGRATGNRFGRPDVIDRAVAAGASVHVVIEHFPPSMSLWRHEPCAAFVSMVTATGGSCLLNTHDGPKFEPPIEQARRVVKGLHQRYAIGFNEDRTDGRVHAVEVRVKNRGLIVRAPRHYRSDR